MSAALEWLERVAEASAEREQFVQSRASAEAHLRNKFAAYMAGDLTAHTGKGTAAQVLEDALGYRDFMHRALVILAKCPEAQGLIAEAGAAWAARECDE